MALLGSISVADRFSTLSSGAAFLLSKKSRVSEVREVSKDVFLEVNPNVNYVVARFNNATTPQDAWELGHECVQQGLDLLSILGKDDLTIRDANDENLIWWRDEDLQILRVVSTSTLNFDVSPARLTVRDQNGSEVQNPEIEPTYHYAFRFFRLSQVTEDLYDAYRNMYLAFELLLSSQYPKQKKEKEIDWLHRGLKEADASMNFSVFVPTSTGDLVNDIVNTVYKNARLPLFHAKHGRDFYPPQSILNRQAVKKALDLLTKIVLKFSESCYNARRLGGGVFSKWVYENTSRLFSSAKMLMSDDSHKFDPTQADLNHDRYKSAVWLDTQLLPIDETRGKGPTLLGKVSNKYFGDIEYVRRFEIVGKKAPYIGHAIENNLTLTGIDRLECQFDTRVSNVRQPKSMFSR
jgi:hypothetical protein